MGSVATPLSSRTVSCATLRALQLDGPPAVLELSGEADIATIGMLRQVLARLTAVAPAPAVVDVSALVFCDVASAHLILVARRRSPVTVVGATGSVERVFALVDALHSQPWPTYESLARPADLLVLPCPSARQAATGSGRDGEAGVATGFGDDVASDVA